MKHKNKVTITLSGIYLIILTWIILFKMQLSMSDFGHIRSVNLIPFDASVIVNGKMDFDEIINNAIAFIPIGVYTGMLFPDWPFVKKVCPAAGLSFAYEVLQFIFALGTTDITDLIMNTLGGIAGVFIFVILSKIFGARTDKILNILAGVCIVLLIALVAVLIAVNL